MPQVEAVEAVPMVLVPEAAVPTPEEVEAAVPMVLVPKAAAHQAEVVGPNREEAAAHRGEEVEAAVHRAHAAHATEAVRSRFAAVQARPVQPGAEARR